MCVCVDGCMGVCCPYLVQIGHDMWFPWFSTLGARVPRVPGHRGLIQGACLVNGEKAKPDVFVFCFQEFTEPWT